MQMFTVQAATPASAAALYSALSPFHPELETDDEGRCSVSVALGSDRQVLEVLDAIPRASPLSERRRNGEFDGRLARRLQVHAEGLVVAEPSTRLGSSALENVARRFHERQLEDAPESIAALIHDSAEMILLVNHLQPLRGRLEIVASLERQDRERELYSATVESFEWLDEATVLVCGQARYATEDGGWAVSRVWWLDQFRDDLLWRVRASTDESDAHAWRQATVALLDGRPSA
jgi:hypothetical protein